MLSATDQLYLELVNRARLDPLGEAERYRDALVRDLREDGRSADAARVRDMPAADLLNFDLAGNESIDGTAKQVLAPDPLLNAATLDHSRWVLANDRFQHVQPAALADPYIETDGEPGAGPTDRIVTAGIDLQPTWRTGENLSLYGSTGAIDTAALIPMHHENLYLSPGHRPNIMNGAYRQTGIGEAEGIYPIDGVRDYNSSMLTQKFLLNGTGETFLTGVAYDDADGDAFYSIGEGRGGVALAIAGAAETTTAEAGGYVLAVTDTGRPLPVTIRDGDSRAEIAVDLSGGNAKLDIVGPGAVAASADLALVSGIASAALLGVDALSLTGGNGHETLHGNPGANTISGGPGRDLLRGADGDDTLDGGGWADRLAGGRGADEMSGGAGPDRMWGGDGSDTLKGGGWADRLFGNGGFDRVSGGPGDDLIAGGWKRDRLFGGDHDDTVLGQHGHDIQRGGRGADTLKGGPGNDRLWGGGQADMLLGGSGADRLVGQRGADTLTGGAGADTFVFGGRFWQDEIADFQSGIDRVVMYSRNGEADDYTTFMAHTQVQDGDLVYNMHGDPQNRITIAGVTELSDSDFVFL